MTHNFSNSKNSLLLKIAEGNERAFGQLFKTYDNQLNGYIMSITKSEPLTQEMVQDVFLKIWINRSCLTQINSFKSYLFVIARNHAFDCLKRINREKRREKEWVNIIMKEASNEHEESPAKLFDEKIDEVVRLLPSQQKKVYSLKRGGMKQVEIAQELNISVETVKKHMSLAMRFLKNQLRANVPIS